MHILLVKVQQKILDDKIDELIAHLTDGLEVAHLQIATRQTSNAPIRDLISAFSIMLDIMALQKDFGGCFKHLPKAAKALLQEEPLTIDKHHEVYELLKEKLLDINNHVHETDHRLQVFAQHFYHHRPFFEAYFNLWHQLMVNKLSPSPRILERMAYGTLTLLDLMVEEKIIHGSVYKPTDEDTALMLRYNQNRIMRIDEAMMEEHYDFQPSKLDPNSQRIPCLRCGSYGALKGYTEASQNQPHFIAFGFQCNQCGMELFDQKDLLLAGIKTIYTIA